jgi:2,3-bisphosphoglycerate-independent phosphoglycerate mutase
VKYVIIIPDGAADLPLPALGDCTPFEVAHMPHTQELARKGRVGCAFTTPEGFEAGSDVCSMSLLGYSPQRYHTGRAPLEAAALGLNLAPSDWIFRLNLVTTGGFPPGSLSASASHASPHADSPAAGTSDAGLMLDHSAGAISDVEARALVTDLVEHWRTKLPEVAKAIAVTPGVSYRNILIDRSERTYADVQTTPPHAIPREPWQAHLPTGGPASQALRELMLSSAHVLPEHPINKARIAKGQRPATMAWLWGQGTKPSVPTFESRFGLRGAMITSVDLLAGIASYIGWERLHVPGLTSYHDTDYVAQGLATVEALSKYDVVCCHVEAPDEASHQGDTRTKVASLEAIDEHIVAPVVKGLARFGDPEVGSQSPGWRLLIMPDHYTLCSTRKHDATPVPFLMAGAWIRSTVARPFTEEAALASDLKIDPGHDLMEYFLRGGRAGVR